MENLKYTYNQVNDWIKTADQKAMILGSFNAAGFVYQLISLDEIECANNFTLALFFISLVATFVAGYFWMMIIYPRLENNLKVSKIYYAHIANAYTNNLQTGIEELSSMSDEEYKKDLSSQIVINSIIAKRKYRYIQKFVWAFSFQIFTLICLSIVILV